MTSLILQTATRLLFSLFLLFSVFLLFRGHHEPGGGFAGGLVAAAAFGLYAIAYDVASARRAMRVSPVTIIGSGLLLAVASGALALLRGQPYGTGVWAEWTLPGMFAVKLGTPLLFDVGVYLVVFGMASLILLTLGEE